MVVTYLRHKMFIHVSPDPDTVGEIVSTLKFAERVSTVELGPTKTNNEVVSYFYIFSFFYQSYNDTVTHKLCYFSFILCR